MITLARCEPLGAEHARRWSENRVVGVGWGPESSRWSEILVPGEPLRVGSPVAGEHSAAVRGQSSGMVDPPAAADSATYEIRIRGAIARPLSELFPDLRVGWSPVETVLYRDISDLVELDLLLERLQSMGLVLSELRENPPAFPTSPEVRSYEVHVEGRLGQALLGTLGWSSRIQPEQSVVRMGGEAGDLDHLLESCSECGLVVDRVARIAMGTGGAR
jgi:hypothetical protein